LEEHGLPVVWGHEGLPTLFFDYWANTLRKPNGEGLASRADAQKAMLKKIIGATVFMLQSPDTTLLPDSSEKISSMNASVKMVEAKVVAGLFIPRWQKISEVDKYGNPTNQSQVTFDGSGYTVDFVTNGYNKHTSDFINWIKRSYPDDSRDNGQTNRLFSALPNPNLVMAKFCMKPLAGDPDAPKTDVDGNPVTSASYGRFIMALEIQK
jgi:hypothetical protein